jgi:predicted ester cyclase
VDDAVDDALDDALDAAALEAFYRRYLARCNDHRFGELDEFVADDVVVNGQPQELRGYTAGLAEVVRRYPDYHWDLRHLLVNPPWLAAHFFDTGADGTFRSQEFAFYRVEGGRIVEVWVGATRAA